MNAIQYTPSEVKDFILAVLEDLLPICKSPELIESVRNILRWGGLIHLIIVTEFYM